MTRFAWIFGLALLAGCGFHPQTVTLAPQVNVAAENIGAGAPVTVQVFDNRSAEQKTATGMWGKPGKAAPIAVREPAAAIQAAIEQGLKQKGFAVAPGGKPLTVELRSLAYANDYQFWTIGLHTAGVLHAKAGTYEKTYNATLEKRSMIAPWEARNAEWLSQAVGDAIAQMLADPALLGALRP